MSQTVGDRHLHQLPDGPALDLDRPSSGVEPGAVAARTRRLTQKLRQGQARSLLVTPGQSRVQDIDHAAQPLVITVKDELALPGGQLAERFIERDAVFFQATQQARPLPLQAGFGQRQERVLAQGLVRIGDQQLGVEFPPKPLAAALGTRPLAAVEREHPRVKLGIAQTAGHAEQFFAVDALRLGAQDVNRAIAHPQRVLEQAVKLLRRPVGRDLTDHDLNIVLPKTGQAHVGRNLDDPAVNACPDEAQLARAGQHVFVKPLAATHDRRQDAELLVAEVGLHQPENAAAALGRQRLAAGHTVLHADLGVQQPQIVRDFGHRGHRRVPPAPAHALFNGDRRRNARQQIDIRFGQDLDELAGVGRQAVDIATLSLGIHNVKHQRGLARPGQPGDHDHLIPRNIEGDILEIMLLGAHHTDRRIAARSL